MVKPQIKWTEDKLQFLYDTYPTEGSKPCMDKYHIRNSAVIAMARLKGIKCLKSKNLNKLQVLYTDTNINYYWYGFIMADGYLDNEGELKITLSSKDKEHLQIFADLLNVNLKTKTQKTSFSTGEYSHVTCKDAKYGILIKEKLNITHNKTYNPPNLDFLDTKEKFLCFFAGFCDGDGMIGFRRDKVYLLRIMCHFNWKENLEFFKTKLKEYFNFSITVSVTKKGYAYLSLSTSGDIKKLKEELIKLNIPLLNRKWDKV